MAGRAADSSRRYATATRKLGCVVLLHVNRTRALAGLFALLLCSGCAGVPSPDGQGASTARSPVLSAEGAAFSVYDHIRFQHPAGWRTVPVTFTTASFTPDDYWTNEPTVPECRPDPDLGGHTSCGPPLAQLTRGGALVIVIDLPALASSFHPNRRVAGHAASVRSKNCTRSTCPAGASRTLVAKIRVAGHPSRDLISTLQLQAYFGPGTAEQLAKVMRRVLEDARPV